MIKAAVAVALLSVFFVACGGGGDDDGGSSGGGGTGAMAANFETELGKTKECIQGEIDGKGACAINFLLDPVTRMCSDVRTGKTNAAFPDADLSKFTATCDEWRTFQTADAAAKVTSLDKMIAGVTALK